MNVSTKLHQSEQAIQNMHLEKIKMLSAMLSQKSKSEKMRETLRFPNKSEWINEFKENWYKENSGVLSNRVTDNLWKETERTIDMIYKYQRKSFEEALKQYDEKGGGDEA